MPTDWFRKSTWSAADQQDFEARLKRSRGVHSKSQYLRIQAYHLQHAEPPLYSSALTLIERVLREFRDDSQVAPALLQKAECVLATSGFAVAAAIYREALEFEKLHPKWRTSAWLDFPWQIAKHRRVDLFDEALGWLASSPNGMLLPLHSFRASTVLAIIKMQKGDHVFARSCAKDAYTAATATHSGLRYHKDLGLVAAIEPWAKAELDRILAA